MIKISSVRVEVEGICEGKEPLILSAARLFWGIVLHTTTKYDYFIYAANVAGLRRATKVFHTVLFLPATTLPARIVVRS